MARSRRGSFGLRPRVAPDVTNTVVALAREYVAKRDALIMDAWRNGGTFEGKKATDQMVLAYWKERETGLDKGDPDYEQAKDQIMQLQYGIEQSKADLLHVQGKMSDEAYAQFFIRWAKKVPANSEFYRTLQKDAAQLIESAKNKARINGERARTEAFNTFVKTTTAKDIAIGDALTAAISDLSNKTGLSITGNGDELLSLLTQNVKANPAQYRVLLDTIHAADPNWNGQFTDSYFTTKIKQASQGYDLIADRAQKAGFVSAYASAAKGEATMSSWGQNLQVWPVAASYTQAENAFLRVWNDPNASQMEKTSAAMALSGRLSLIANTPGIDTASKTMIEADAARLRGEDGGDSPSFGTAMLGRQGVDPKTAMQLGAWHAVDAEMKANPTAWAYASVDANGQFDPTGRGPLGIVPSGSIPPGSQAVMVPQANGQAVLAMMPVHTVYTSDPNDPSASPKTAGYQISYNVGGRTVQMWGYVDAQGSAHWSLNSPVAQGATTTIDNKGDVYVKPGASAATDPLARARKIDAKYGTNITALLQAQQGAGAPLGGVKTSAKQLDGNGHTTATIEITYNNGEFKATQTQNTLNQSGQVIGTQTVPVTIDVSDPSSQAFSASALHAGDIPGVTFNSPLAASVAAGTQTQNTDQISKFASDPAFQQAFLSQTMQTLGTTNPYDSRLAEAWKNITTPNAPAPSALPVADELSSTAKTRADLNYPGQKAAQSQVPLSVTFGGQTLQLPGLPSAYTGGAESQAGSQSNMFSGLSAMLPGLGLAPMPSQHPAGSPTATAPTPTPTPTPTPVTPTPVRSPDIPIAPAPTPAPVLSTPHYGRGNIPI